MILLRSIIATWIAISIFLTTAAQADDDTVRLTIEPGKKVAFVGNSLGERMNLFGHFETRLQFRFGKDKPVFRNFSWPTDAVEAQKRPANYTLIDDPFTVYSPEVLICFFGFNESFAGSDPKALGKFERAYERYLDSMTNKLNQTGVESPAFALVSPIAFETTGKPHHTDGVEQTKNLAAYTKVIRALAAKRQLPFVDLYTPTAKLFAAEPGAQYTINGCHLNEAGDKAVGEILEAGLFGEKTDVDAEAFERVRTAVNDKSWLHLQDYRMLNGWYVYGGRRTWDTKTFPGEFRKIRSMVGVRDQYINDIVMGKEVPAQPDDSKTGEVFIPETLWGKAGRFGENREPKTLEYPTPEQSIEKMKVPKGFKVEMFASEREFPELANPTQIAFDSKGRLWVSCMINYPQWLPNSSRPSDSLLILEDTDGDGKADKSTKFYDKLICPTGFELHKDGVLVIDEPRILFLRDTDGDDKADEVTHLIDGIGTDDTHHAMGAWEYSPGGRLHMLEGISLTTTIETPWGPVRRLGRSGAYVWDLESMKIEHFLTPGNANPWCLVWDKDGHGVVGDGTGSNQFWTSPFSGGQTEIRSGLDPIFNNEGMRPSCGNEFLETRQFPAKWHDKLVYSCVINMHGFPAFEVVKNDEGVTGLTGKRIEDLIDSSDSFFRPVDPKIGPDGALWFGDWCNALIGHMQYSQRDPNRDHQHGRIYRLVHSDTPLLKPVLQHGKSIDDLLQQLVAFEPRTRYRARRELAGREPQQVLDAVTKWVAASDEPEVWLEGLWIQENFHGVDTSLIEKILEKGNFKQRASAMHVVGNEMDFLADATALLEKGIVDANGRVRLETIRAASLDPTLEHATLAFKAISKDTDKWIDYTLEHAIRSFEGVLDTEQGESMLAAQPAEVQDYLSIYKKARGAGDRVVKPMKILADAESTLAEKNGAVMEVVASPKGKASKGNRIFRRVCMNCHRYENRGVQFGPELTHVGDRMTKEQIIRSIIWPNEEISKGYETIVVLDSDGISTSGFILEETDEKIVLGIKDGKTKEILKDDIEDQNNMKASSMPEGLAETISPTEFVNLLAFMMGDWVATHPSSDVELKKLNGNVEVSRQSHVLIPSDFPRASNREAQHFLSPQGGVRTGIAVHTQEESKTKEPNILIRFNEPAIVRSVQIANCGDATIQHRARGLTLSVSEDGENWKEVWTAPDAFPDWQFDIDSPKPIKYAKLWLKGEGILHLQKATFFGEIVEAKK